MIKRFKVGDIRVTFTIARTAKVIGVNSSLGDGRHILMWDFDNVPLSDVAEALGKVQARYLLSDIYILETKANTNFLAYCFTALEWRRVVEIVTQTQYVCWSFVKMAIVRDHLTLRVTAKQGRQPKLVLKLAGYEQPDCEPIDLRSWVRYETLVS